MKRNFFICATLVLMLMSCNNRDVKSKTPVPTTSNSTEPAPGHAASLLELDVRLKEMDSLVIVFYNDPHGSDSLRYSRYYKEYHTTDAALISQVNSSLQAKTERLEKIKDCRNEGKIWCFAKGDIFQTIYFSSHNEACNFVYIISNGQFYYSDLKKSLAQKLSELQPLASEPLNSVK